MSTVFQLDARNYSFTDGAEITTPFNETGLRAYEINKIPTTSPYNENALGPVFQTDAPKRFDFEIVGGASNPYSGLILPATVNSELTDLGGSAFSMVTAFRMRDFHVSASNSGIIMFCQGVGGDPGVWFMNTLETGGGSNFRIRFGTTNAAGTISLIAVMNQILAPDTWWIVSFNFNGSSYFWHLDTAIIADIGSGITNPGTRTSVASGVGISNAAASSMDGDLGYVGIFKPNLSDTALRTVECDLMDYFKGQPCPVEPSNRNYCGSVAID